MHEANPESPSKHKYLLNRIFLVLKISNSGSHLIFSNALSIISMFTSNSMKLINGITRRVLNMITVIVESDAAYAMKVSHRAECKTLLSLSYFIISSCTRVSF